jgi:hypothetical protein
MSSDFGIFQFLYSGTPQTTILDVGYSFAPPAGAFPVDIVNRGKWINVSQDPNTGAISAGNPFTFRTPWYTQSDFSFTQNYKISERKVLSFSATIPNILNQRAITAYYPLMDSQQFGQYLAPGGNIVFAGVPAYAAYEKPYDYLALLNGSTGGNTAAGIATVNSQYGQPYLYQLARSIRLSAKFVF